MIVPRSPRFSLWPTKLGFVSSTNLARPFRGLVCISVDDPPLISPLQTHRRRRPAGSAQAALDSDTADFDARNAPTPISCSPLARLGPPAASFPTRHRRQPRISPASTKSPCFPTPAIRVCCQQQAPPGSRGCANSPLFTWKAPLAAYRPSPRVTLTPPGRRCRCRNDVRRTPSAADSDPARYRPPPLPPTRRGRRTLTAANTTSVGPRRGPSWGAPRPRLIYSARSERGQQEFKLRVWFPSATGARYQHPFCTA